VYPEHLDQCPRCGRILSVEVETREPVAVHGEILAAAEPEATDAGEALPWDLLLLGWLGVVTGGLGAALFVVYYRVATFVAIATGLLLHLLADGELLRVLSDLVPTLYFALASATLLAIGVGLLRRRNWARWVCAIGGAVGLALWTAISPGPGRFTTSFAWAVVFYAALLIVVFRRSTSVLFAGYAGPQPVNDNE
jgi:hypothetical protein